MDTLQGQQLLDQKGNLKSADEVLADKNVIVYYFSASWCPPSKLLSLLKKIHNENLKRKSGLEIIYVSSDSEKALFEKHFFQNQGGWFAIPYQDPISDELKYKYNVTNIPHVVAVKRDGSLITKRGKNEIEEIGINVLVTWIE